jgi:oligopeptide/dipeptide ABC transporter ATP-binding protein
VPRLDANVHEALFSIEGLPPRLDKGPFTACTFAPRCPQRRDACMQGEPALEETAPGRKRRCVVPVEELA